MSEKGDIEARSKVEAVISHCVMGDLLSLANPSNLGEARSAGVTPVDLFIIILGSKVRGVKVGDDELLPIELR